MQGQDTDHSRQEHIGQIISRQPDWLEKTLGRIEQLVPRFLKPRTGFLLSFKNRILIGTLLVVVSVVVVIGIILQLTVLPLVKDDAKAVLNIKVIHFLASLAMIAISWLFIELISKKIARPLLDLTKRADQISREAGGASALSEERNDTAHQRPENGLDHFRTGDEIVQLTSSFNRMLVHLKASEDRLRESEEKYRFLFDNGPFPIFVIDADDMRILDVNARAVEEYQYTGEELLTMSFADLGLDRDREQTRNRFKRLFPTEVTLLPVVPHTRLDGSVFMVNFQARTCRYQDQPAIIVAVWDVTERLEKHAMLIQASKMATLGEMATGIAHELNQPLNVIRLGCDYLVKRIRTGRPLSISDLTHVHGELTASVDRAARIISHLREFGRKSEETMHPTDINKPIRNVFTLLGTQLAVGGIKWSLDLQDDLPAITGDTNRLEQVFINLVLNARDAMTAGNWGACRDTVQASNSDEPRWKSQSGLSTIKRPLTDGRPEKSVKIRSFFHQGAVVVTVSDSGPGIPGELRSRVFEPFFTTKEPGKGTGLGLSISYAIVKEHGGTIEVDATQTAGATFRLEFPVQRSS